MNKTIDIKSLLIGFLLATSVILFMGATSNNENGRYQAFGIGTKVYQYMIDTTNGEMYMVKGLGLNYDQNSWKKITKDENWIVR